jgi:hypothetical protein
VLASATGDTFVNERTAERTCDRDLREVVHAVLKETGVWYRDEVGIGRGSAVVDVLSTDGSALFGYEIKSARDTLRRLPVQCAVYDTALDYTTIVCDPFHAIDVERAVPSHCGIVCVCRRENGSLEYDSRRPATRNPNVHANGLFSLVWRDELLRELERLRIAKGARRSKHQMQTRYLEHCSIDDLRYFVCKTIEHRLWPTRGSAGL